MNFYYVGGYVRDKILGVDNKDIDFAVEAESYEQMRDYIAANGTIFLEKPEFFTIRAMMTLDGQRRPADFVLCRKEGAYLDGRHPSKVEVGTIYDDLARRDFTMNAIAIKVGTQEIIDPFNGQKDIQERFIKSVNGIESLKEDPLRILRALRFSITKNFKLSYQIHRYLYSDDFNENGLKGVSSERIREELQKMFTFDTKQTIKILTRYGLVINQIFDNTGIWLMPTTKEK